jgi:hypothetical protein
VGRAVAAGGVEIGDTGNARQLAVMGMTEPTTTKSPDIDVKTL